MTVAIHATIPELIVAAAERAPGACALMAPGKPSLTYAELAGRVAGLSRHLVASGIGRNARVAITLPNGPDMSLALLAAASTATAAPLNPNNREPECRLYFEELGITDLLLDADSSSEAGPAAQRLGLRVHTLERDRDGYLTGGANGDGAVTPRRPEPGDVALVLLTSGSTARPKRVPLTHRNLCVSIADIIRSLSLSPADRCLCMWEQYHVGGLVDLLLVPLASGGTVITAGSFNVARFFDLLEREAPTWFQAVPTTLNALVRHARLAGMGPIRSSLRFIRSVAAALSPELMREVEALFGVPVIQTFGMTEAAPLITSTQLPPAVRKPGSTGPSVGPRVGIMAPEGRLLPPLERGEVVVQGENIMSGYENEPALNAEVFRYGWFHTGDVGYLDADGHLFLTGRIREMINRGGEKISPVEIDEVLLRHPGVAEAVAFSIPHATLGEDIAAVVVRAPGEAPVSEAALRRQVEEQLSPFKVPQRIVFVDRIPREANGKVKRLKLAEALGLTQAATGPFLAPRSDTERRLCRLWERILQREGIGVDDEFTALGGDSISSVALMEAAQTEFGRRLPLQALHRMTTVANMAVVLDAHVGDAELEAHGLVLAGLRPDEVQRMLAVYAGGRLPLAAGDVLIKVWNADGARPPLVWCFNSADREMLQLTALTDRDQPVYGLYSGGGQLDYTERVTEAVATYYTGHLRTLLPGRALYLGGNCRGGAVMIRMEAMLRAVGHPVLALCILDYFSDALFRLPLPLLLLMGRQAELSVYRQFKWGHPGWQRAFAGPVHADWVAGEHGTYFLDGNLASLWCRLERFLAGRPPSRSFFAWFARYFWLWFRHAARPFDVYMRLRRSLRRRRSRGDAAADGSVDNGA